MWKSEQVKTVNYLFYEPKKWVLLTETSVEWHLLKQNICVLVFARSRYITDILRVSCKFFRKHLGENFGNTAREKCRNANSAASSWCHPPVKTVAFSPAFLPYKQAAAKYNNQHSLN